jgi:pSer/pThr/pTyr-binding forkhead associated (FHA) protein
LGRKADNEVIFAKDSPVSRHHAVIEARAGQMFLAEILAEDEHTGQPKRPAYGTFVNGVQVQEQVRLKDGDEITLGKRLRMRFEALQIPSTGADRTLDQGSPSQDERTMAAFASGKAVSSNNDVTIPTAGTGKKPGVLSDNDKTFIPGGGQQ